MNTALAYPAALGFALAATPSFADWGGVAVNLNSGTYGYSAGWNTKGDARKRAMHYCRMFSEGQKGCEVIMTTRNCGGIARGSKNSARQYFVAEARNRDAAGAQALANCKAELGNSCKLARSFCAEDE